MKRQAEARTPVRGIVTLLGGQDGPGGRLRTAKAVANDKARLKRARHDGAPLGSSELDYLIQYHVGNDFIFEIRAVADDGETHVFRDGETHVFREKAFCVGDAEETVGLLSGCQFAELHLMLPGTSRLAATYGDVLWALMSRTIRTSADCRCTAHSSAMPRTTVILLLLPYL